MRWGPRDCPPPCFVEFFPSVKKKLLFALYLGHCGMFVSSAGNVMRRADEDKLRRLRVQSHIQALNSQLENDMSKVYIRKACGKGRAGHGYIVMDGKLTVDEIVTDDLHVDGVTKLPLATTTKDDIKADKRAAGGCPLVMAAVVASDYARRHKKDVTPFVARAARAGAPLVKEMEEAVKRLKEARGKVNALKNAAALLKIELDADTPESSRARAEIEEAEKTAENAAEAVKTARKRINEKSAAVEALFYSFRSMGAEYRERPGEELKEPAPAESAK